jgi:hypothetical protein
MSKMVQSVMRILIQTAAIIALLAGAASAQSISPFQAAPKPQLTPEEIEKQQKLDADYKAAVGKLPEHKSADPWGDVRPNTPPKTVKKKQQ